MKTREGGRTRLVEAEALAPMPLPEDKGVSVVMLGVDLEKAGPGFMGVLHFHEDTAYLAFEPSKHAAAANTIFQFMMVNRIGAPKDRMGVFKTSALNRIDVDLRGPEKFFRVSIPLTEDVDRARQALEKAGLKKGQYEINGGP